MKVFNEVRVAIEQHKKYKEEITESLKIIVKDKNIPLEERWQLFFDSDLGTHESYIQRFDSINLDDFYSDFQHKGATIDIDWIFSWYYDKRYSELDEKYTDDEIDTLVNGELSFFQEELLDRFIKSFDFDW